MKATIRFKGGPGSGHHGHQGRPGKRGGSSPSASSTYGALSDDAKLYLGTFGTVIPGRIEPKPQMPEEEKAYEEMVSVGIATKLTSGRYSATPFGREVIEFMNSQPSDPWGKYVNS